MSNKQKNVDLLAGNPAKALIKLSLPIILASYLQILYNITDMFWISSLGANNIAAVGTGGNFMWLATGVMIIPRMGGQVLSGRAYGSQNRKEALKISATALKMGVISSIAVAGIFIVFNRGLIGFFQFNNQETIHSAETYLKAVALGMPAVFLTGIISGLMAAGGNTQIYLKATLIGLLLNMIFDPVLIYKADLKVLGAALATIFAQYIVLIILCIGAARQQFFHGIKLFKTMDKEYYLNILKLGIPAGFQSMFYSLITIVIGRLVAEFGDLQVAVQRVGSQLESITYTVADSLAITLNAFNAQNLAARNGIRLKKGYHFSLVLSIMVGLVGMVLFVGFPDSLANLFFTDSFEIESAKSYLMIVGFSQIFMCLEIMLIGNFAGLGNTFYPSLIATFLTLLRIPMAYFLSHQGLGINGIWYTISGSSIIKGIILLLYYHYYQKHLLENLV